MDINQNFQASNHIKFQELIFEGDNNPFLRTYLNDYRSTIFKNQGQKKTDRFDNNSKSVYLKRNFDILKHMN